MSRIFVTEWLTMCHRGITLFNRTKITKSSDSTIKVIFKNIMLKTSETNEDLRRGRRGQEQSNQNPH